MIDHSDKIVELQKWKEKKTEQQFSDYLKILNFNQLMHESRHLIRELNSEGPKNELLLKSKSMMGEFAQRLEKESQELAKTVAHLKKEIDQLD